MEVHCASSEFDKIKDVKKMHMEGGGPYDTLPSQFCCTWDKRSSMEKVIKECANLIHISLCKKKN